jgi:hypothetical protein
MPLSPAIPRSRVGRLRAAAVASVAVIALPVIASCALPKPPATLPVRLHVNFQPANGVKPPTGYQIDTGQAFNGTLGWETLTGLPMDLRANARARHSAASPDTRWDTLVQMQAQPGQGVTTPGRWVAALRNGTYNVTVTVGDPAAVRSVNRINAQSGTPQAVTIVPGFVPTSAAHWQTVTQRVTVTNNQLILDANGGFNTEINFVDVQPVGAVLPVASAHGPYDAIYKLPRARLVFSSTWNKTTAPPENVVISNSGRAPLTVSNFTKSGASASQFQFTAPVPAKIVIPPGGSRSIGVRFVPTAPVGCATDANPDRIANSNRGALLNFLTDDSTHPLGTIDMAGLVACNVEGINEPTLDQVMKAVGYYTDVIPANSAGRRLGTAGPDGHTDEIISPYFRAANAALPVTLTPIARYTLKDPIVAQRTGWFAKGANAATPCPAGVCNIRFSFPADVGSTYVQNQKLMPVQSGSTNLAARGVFGLFSGENREVGYSVDAFNVALTPAGAPSSPPRNLHNMRVFPAFGPGHRAIPNTYVVAVDISRVFANKNFDFQDDVFVISNVVPVAS